MNLFQLTNRNLPGIRGYLERSPHFHQRSTAVVPSADDLVRLTQSALKAGKLKTGDEFPVPDEMARETGASLFDCLEAMGVLLRGGAIQQDADGRLYVAHNEEYATAPMAS